MDVHIREKDGLCTITDTSGTVLFQIQVRDDLDRAVRLLKQINTTTTGGEPIYELRVVCGVSAWSFHQSRLMWENTRHFAFYEELIKIILSNRYRLCLLGTEKHELVDVLTMSGVPTARPAVLVFKNHLREVRVALINALLGCIAKLVGYSALIWARLRSKTNLIYSPDNFLPALGSDFRMGGMYRYFRKYNVSFVEIFHTLLGRRFVLNMLGRKRFGFYLEFLPLAVRYTQINSAICDPDVTHFEPQERAYVKALISRFDRYSKRSVLKVLTLRRILKFIGIQRLVTIDDMRSSHEIVAACRSLQLPSFAFQHGHINKYHTGHMNYGIPARLSAPFDKLYVWNEYWRGKLITDSTFYSQSNVVVGGYLRPPREVTITRLPLPESPEETHILVANDTWAPREEVRMYLRRFLDLGFHLHLSIRSDIPLEKQLSDFGVGNHPRVHLSQGAQAALEGKVHCVVGVYSTFIYEMLYYELPAFALKTSFVFGDELVEDELAKSLEPNFTFEDIRFYLASATSKRDKLWPDPGMTIEKALSDIFSSGN